MVDLWFAQQPWTGPDRADVTARIISRAIELVEASRPLLPACAKPWRCVNPGAEDRPASASPLRMLEKVLTMLNCATSLTPWPPPSC
ncbi:Phosphatase YniC [Raoultella terrigena]|uniref:Phosphatase YniC n=1 Tax=Raoultella terrigena TaxID=577 RepID=A0A4U9CYR6_RAOTE|nr:Phosphatase YniC [Raoultella terrigena]